MPDTRYLLGLVLVSAAITWGLRAVPFAVLAPMRRSPLIGRLAAQLPLGVMIILALSTMRGVPVHDGGRALGFLIAVAVTIALQLWRRSFMLSIVAGTATYVLISTALNPH
jgi:branched-subunit amino acid transport protein AzlD